MTEYLRNSVFGGLGRGQKAGCVTIFDCLFLTAACAASAVDGTTFGLGTIVPPSPCFARRNVPGSGRPFALRKEKAAASISLFGMHSCVPARCYNIKENDDEWLISSIPIFLCVWNTYANSSYMNLCDVSCIQSTARLLKCAGFLIHP